MRATPEEPRHAEPDHHAHDDADMREDVVGEGELLFHGGGGPVAATLFRVRIK